MLYSYFSFKYDCTHIESLFITHPYLTYSNKKSTSPVMTIYNIIGLREKIGADTKVKVLWRRAETRNHSLLFPGRALWTGPPPTCYTSQPNQNGCIMDFDFKGKHDSPPSCWPTGQDHFLHVHVKWLSWDCPWVVIELHMNQHLGIPKDFLNYNKLSKTLYLHLDCQITVCFW